jgi:arylsulfatase A-like enzyme
MKKTIMALVAAILFAGMAPAALVKTFTSQLLTSSVMTNDYLAVSVQAGDVVVMTAVGNKTPSTPVEFSSTAGAFTLYNTVAANVNPTVYSGYLTIATTGSYDFHARAANAIWGYSGLYILRADLGAIRFLASANYAEAASSAADQTLSYDWGGAGITNGLAIEAVAGSVKDVITPNDVSRDGGNTNQRILCSGFFTGSSFSSSYSFAVAMKSSGIGLAFAEGSASPLPPDFGSDPVVKNYALPDVAYAGTLANDASDPNGDPMTFLLSPGGPAWLAVATDGSLSGTPSASDLGTNQWTVSVTDGISGTNSATLQIVVTDSEFSPVPLTSPELYVQGAHYVNIDAVGMNFHRLDFEESYSNVSEGKAKTTTGAKLSFYTASDTVKLYFTYIPGDENRNSRFGIYQNGEQVDTPYFAKTQTNVVITLTSQSAPGELVRYDVVLPNWSNPILTKMELKNGEALEAGNPYPRKKMVVLGDSISHGTGQGASYLTYPYQAAEMMDLELFNLAVGGGKIAPEVADLLQDFDPVEAIWILVGYNDWQGGSESTNSIATDYEELLATVRQRQPDAEVFCCTLTFTHNTNDVESGVTDTEVRQAVSDVVNARIAAGDAKLHLVQGDEYSDASFLKPQPATDLVHFTEIGAAMFATNVVSIMDPIVNPPKPNILFIAIDDINPIIGAYGNPLIQTPNMDRLAARGMLFENAHCQWAVCGPSRASLMTGLMPEQTGVMGFVKMRGMSADGLRDNARGVTNLVALPQHFRNNGYATAASGKENDARCVGSINPDGTINEDGGTVDDPPSWSLGFTKPYGVGSTKAYSPDLGKTLVLAAESVDLPATDFSDGKIADEGLAFLRTLAAGSEPFFLGVGFKKPHLPFLAPKASWDLYQDSDFEPHPFQTEMLNVTPYTFNNIHELRGSYYLDLDGNGDALVLTNGILPDAQQRRLLHGYYACISHVDEQVGRLLDELDALGIASNTIVVLWGDHGFHLGDHNEWGKHTNLEQASHMPLIISAPGYPQGLKTQAPVGLIDLYPTLCELAALPQPVQPPVAGGSVDRPLSGHSLVPILGNPAARVQTGIMNHYASGTYGYAYRTERYRYTEWIDSSRVVQAQELYDYQTDPMETVNLAVYPEYDALMYQFSRAAREPSECGGCNRLKSTPAMAEPANKILPALDGSVNGANMDLAWPDAAGATYNILEKTNLLDAAWTTNQADVAGSPASVPADLPQGFYRVEVSN